MNNLRDKIADIIHDGTGVLTMVDDILALPEIAELQAKLAEAEANINIKADWIEATINDMSANEEATQAAIFRAYQMGLDAAANVLLAKHTNNVGMVHPITGSDCKDIRALQPPADLMKHLKGTDHA